MAKPRKRKSAPRKVVRRTEVLVNLRVIQDVPEELLTVVSDAPPDVQRNPYYRRAQYLRGILLKDAPTDNDEDFFDFVLEPRKGRLHIRMRAEWPTSLGFMALALERITPDGDALVSFRDADNPMDAFTEHWMLQVWHQDQEVPPDKEYWRAPWPNMYRWSLTEFHLFMKKFTDMVSRIPKQGDFNTWVDLVGDGRWADYLGWQSRTIKEDDA